MNGIHILDNSLINKIAAGEVVERPSSVVKELMENAIDAGASKISVEIIGGGVDYIKISDNGKGIPKEQVETAFKRHATSKLESIDDLEDIMTLGFRGEALSSIASVSQVEIITKTADEQTGIKLELSGGEITKKTETSALVGTVITVKNLFYNTPARKKFLKKASTESGYVGNVVNRMALGHPDVSIRYTNNKTIVINTSGKGDIKDCVFYIYGKEISKGGILVSTEKNGYRLSGIIGKPEISRANRAYENFFINGRFIKNAIVSDAVEDAYRGRLMGGRFPLFILDMKVPPNTVDINVHPAKIEARFSDEDFIYEFVYDTVYNTLKKETLIPGIKLKEKNIVKNEEPLFSDNYKNDTEKEEQKKLSFQENREELTKLLEEELLMTEEDETKENGELSEKEKDYNKKEKPPENISLNDIYSYKENDYSPFGGVLAFGESDFNERKTAEKEEFAENNNLAVNNEFAENNNPVINNDESTVFDEALMAEEDLTNKKADCKDKKESFLKNYKIIGQVFKTYWLIEKEDSLYIIDQHAAHERVIYEEFTNKLKDGTPLSQRLIQPFAVSLTEKETDVFEKNKELIENFGFEFEEFGKNTYAIRSVPYIFKNPENAAFFKDIIDILSQKRIESVYDTKLDDIAKKACKAAVKGNDRLDYTEARALIEKIISMENPFNCPHGRPTIVKITKYDIEKFFKRVL